MLETRLDWSLQSSNHLCFPSSKIKGVHPHNHSNCCILFCDLLTVHDVTVDFSLSTEYNTLLEKHRDWMLQNCSDLVSVVETALLADSLAPPQDVLANHPACV